MTDKITDKIAALPPGATFFSLEFFPPKTEAGQNNLQARLSRMSRALRPTFVNVTWGAGGSTSGRSLELAELCQCQLGLTTCLHLTCTNMSRHVLDATLRACRDIGVRNILALRGDPPRRYEYGLDDEENGQAAQTTNEEFVWAADLVRYIRKEYGDWFCIGVAGYPEGHSDESTPEAGSQSVERDLPYLAEKVQAGADFIMTQLFYDVQAYLKYEKAVASYGDGSLAGIPIIPGLMPVQNFSGLKRITKLSHASLPPDVVTRLEAHKTNDEEVKKIGVDILSDIVQTIKATPPTRPRARGFHFYTLNLEKSVSYIVERCALIPPLTASDYTDGSAIADDLASDRVLNGDSLSPMVRRASSTKHSRGSSHKPTTRRPSSPHNHTMDDGSTVTSEPPSRATTLAITHGVGSLGREATWDDYPNGRFGDARSPAFGEIDGYGPSIHMSPASARLRWGFPTSMSDLQDLFKSYLSGGVDALPWTEGPLSSETKFIGRELRALIEKGWLSVASQPAVDAVPSEDAVFGWGPRGGFVFQKAFVEMFVPASDWRERLRPRLMKEARQARVSWYASTGGKLPSGRDALKGNGVAEVSETKIREEKQEAQVELEKEGAGAETGEGDAEEGFESSEPDGAANSVTWGAFPGKEIASPTIIEETSFRAWAEEAFNLWAEWERCYPPGKTRQFLRQCREDLYLVNVIGHGFRRPSELWGILLDT